MRLRSARGRHSDVGRVLLSLLATCLFALVFGLEQSATVDSIFPQALVPSGWEVVDAEPPEGRSAQPAGPARRAGWAWRARDKRTGLTFVLVEPGEFTMGLERVPLDPDRGKLPEQTTRIEHPFYMLETELTVAQWYRGAETWSYQLGEAFAKGLERREAQDEARPWRDTTRVLDLPIDEISWYDAQDFIGSLNFVNDIGMDRSDFYRLPSEAEWEYVCRAGTTTRFSTGERIDGRYARFGCSDESFAAGPKPVKSYAPNAWGFHDMHGNVREWCEDRFDRKATHDDVYDYFAHSEEEPGEARDWMSVSWNRVLKGGGWHTPPQLCQSGWREGASPTERKPGIGFRLVRTIHLSPPRARLFAKKHRRLGDYRMRLRELGEDYGVRIESDLAIEPTKANARLSITRADQLDLIYGSLVFESEMRRYPRTAFLHSNPRVVLCGSIHRDKKVLHGFHRSGDMYLRLNSMTLDHFRSIIHHEVFHYFESGLYHFEEIDFEWHSLNDPAFRYIGDSWDPLRHREFDSEEFISSYAQMSSAEDKAETFAFMIQNMDSLENIAELGEVLRAKVELLASRYGRFNFCNLVDH